MLGGAPVEPRRSRRARRSTFGAADIHRVAHAGDEPGGHDPRLLAAAVADGRLRGRARPASCAATRSPTPRSCARAPRPERDPPTGHLSDRGEIRARFSRQDGRYGPPNGLFTDRSSAFSGGAPVRRGVDRHGGRMSIVWGIRWDRRTHAALLALVAGLVAAFALHTNGPRPQARRPTPPSSSGATPRPRGDRPRGGTIDKDLKPLGMYVARVPADSLAGLARLRRASPERRANSAVEMLEDSAPAAPVSETLPDVRTTVADSRRRRRRRRRAHGLGRGPGRGLRRPVMRPGLLVRRRRLAAARPRLRSARHAHRRHHRRQRPELGLAGRGPGLAHDQPEGGRPTVRRA